MKHKVMFTNLILLILLIVVGCSGSQMNTQKLTPPKLMITVDDSTIIPIMGTYSWSHKNSDGTTTAIEADADAPPGLVKNEEPVNVTACSDN